MNQGYDNDDIVEDWDEVQDESQARRVQSVGGGPVARPSGQERPVRPSDHIRPSDVPAPEDGMAPPDIAAKVAKRNKMIWAVCILFSVGVGTVLVLEMSGVTNLKGMLWGHQGNTQAANNKPKDKPKRPVHVKELTKRGKAIEEFKGRSNGYLKTIRANSKAYDFFELRRLKFLDAREAANKDDKNEEKWAKAIKAWWDLKYGADLFVYAYDPSGDLLFEVDMLDFGDYSSFEDLTEEQLADTKIQKICAAARIINSMASKWNAFQADYMKYDPVCSKVNQSDDWKPTWKDEYEKFMALQGGDTSKIQDDIDFVTGPDYKDDEKTMREKYEASKGE